MSLEKSIDKFAKTSYDAMDAISAHAVESINKIGLIVEAQATRITELQAQLADAKQVANDCRIVADDAIAEALGAKKDAERYQALRRGQKWSVIDGIGDTLRAEGLDEAIDDAAISEGKQA